MDNNGITTTNRKQADGIVALVLTAILLVGGIATWQAYQQWTALNEMTGHMGMNATAVHGTHPIWYVLGTIVAVSVIGGIYLGLRDGLGSPHRHSTAEEPSTNASTGVPQETEVPIEQRERAKEATDQRILDLLPDDERRILEPVLESPGLTQLELRDRSDFSKSKVSQTVTALEKRGLLYREPQGQTYRIYPSDELGPEQ